MNRSSASFFLAAKIAAILIAMLATATQALAQNTPKPKTLTPAEAAAKDVEPFRDAISHWQKRFGRDRTDARYDPTQVREIAESLLRYQNPDGGWPKDIDWLAIIDLAEVRRLEGNSLDRSTLDNHNTYSQIIYLAKAFQKLSDPRFRDAATRGLDYVLKEQRPSGGWRGADVDAITYNDGVMAGAMSLLLDVSNKAPLFAWVEESKREACKKALDRAIDVTLKCQIVVNGRKTGWCQQHDHTTLAPVEARSFELASLASDESAGVLEFLMRIENPTPAIRESIEAVAAWLESAKILHTRVERFKIEPARFDFHTATEDLRVIEDPAAPPIWARYYEIETNRPFYCDRNRKKVYTLAELSLERRTGSGWLGTWPAGPLKKYARWKARNPTPPAH